MPFWTDDLPHMFADFGVDATVAGVAVRGIFEDGTETGSMGLIGMDSPGPVLLMASSDVPAAAHGAAVVLPAGTYTVRQALHDGTGVCNLVLQRAA